MGVSSAPARAAEFREALAAGALTADGAMGTMLSSKLALGGAFRHRCLDELNLSLPALVRDVHQEYLRAGAQILETNTFGANRKRLGAYGFGEKVRAINRAGVRIAREAARVHGEGAEAFVAGTVGPLGVRLEPLGLTTPAEARAVRAVFREQIDALVESGVDLLVLETFQDLQELHEAILAAREAAGPDLAVAAHLSVEDDGTLACGATPREFTQCLEEWPVDLIGLNCSPGPRTVLETIEKLAAWTGKPLSARPNAGLPSLVDGQSVYPCSPAYMAQYARRFLRAGVRIVGGCCGTTPEHIRQIRGVLNETPVEPAPRPIATVIEEPAETARAIARVPAAERSQLGAKLASGRFVIVVEMLPPRGPDGSEQIAAAIQYKQAGIDCIAVPDGPRGGARMSAPAVCQLIQQHAGIECVLRFRGQDRGALALQSELLGAHALGIRNVLCGVDPAGLTAMASYLNQGLDLGGYPMGSQTSLLVGVAVNPAAADLDQELGRFELHVKAGADYAVTPPVFDLELLEAFLQRIEPYKLPVIAGIWPLTGFRDAEYMLNELRTPVPPAYMARLRAAGNGDAAQTESGEAERAEGLAITLEIVDRVHGLAAGIQLTPPSGRPRLAVDVVEAIVSRRQYPGQSHETGATL